MQTLADVALMLAGTSIYTLSVLGGIWLAGRVMSCLGRWTADTFDTDLRRKETARLMAFRSTLRAVDVGLIRLPRVY